MRTRFALMRIVAVLALIATVAVAGFGNTALASPSRATEGQSAGQEALEEGTPAAQEDVPTDESVTEVPVTDEPTVEAPATDPPAVEETVAPVETDVPASEVPSEVVVTPEATSPATVEAAATEAIEAAAVPTYIFPNPNVIGTVNVAKFGCTGRTTTTFDVDVFAAAASLPSGPGSCTPTSGIFTFTFLGGLPNGSQLMVQNAGSIDLPAGNYDVADESSGVHATFTLGGGQVVNLMVFGPLVGAPPTVAAGDGTVSIAVVDCTNITKTTFDIDTFSAAAAQVDCTNSSARVTFYMVGDGTADYVQRVFTRSGSISLRPGTYEIVVEETQTHKYITVQSGKVVSMVIMKPLKVTGGAVSGSAEGTSEGEVATGPVVTPVAPSTAVTPAAPSTSAGNPATSGTGASTAGAASDATADGVTDDTDAVALAGAGGASGTAERGTARTATTDSSVSQRAPETQRAMPVVTTLPRAGSGPVQGAPLATAWLLAACSLLLFATGRSLRNRAR